MRERRTTYGAWVRDELLLVFLLAAALVLFLVNPTLRDAYELPQLRLFLDTAVALVAAIVAVLAFVRFSVERRRFDLFLATGFFVAALSTLAFFVVPTLGGEDRGVAESWTGVFGRLLAALLIAAAPFLRGRAGTRQAFVCAIAATAGLAVVWSTCRDAADSLPVLTAKDAADTPLLTVVLAVQALTSLVALVGFGLRYRARGEDLDRWLAFGATLGLFTELHAVLARPLPTDEVSQAEFLRLLAYAILLVGVWRAIRAAEFGRAVAEERARVARDIHDGLAQYLFAITAHTTRLEHGGELDQVLPRLKEAATAAQQEARFAVLALSSAGGSASFDAALSRYVEFLAADGELEIELDIAPDAVLGPDEQIEVFRIVQEGLANVRRHAHARRAVVFVGIQDGERIVSITDDGTGFRADAESKGQGLANMRGRAASIGGGFRLRTRPGGGTAVEVTLRA